MPIAKEFVFTKARSTPTRALQRSGSDCAEPRKSSTYGREARSLAFFEVPLLVKARTSYLPVLERAIEISILFIFKDKMFS
jgi:hypothetical protein